MGCTKSTFIRRFSALGVAAVVLALAACTGAGSPTTQDGSDIGFIPGAGTVITVKPADRKAAPELEGDKVGGGTLALADYRGKVVVLNVWGSWCGPCRKETPDLVAAQKELARSGVAFVGLNTKDNDAAAVAFTRAFAVPYPSFYDPDGSQLLKLRGSIPPKSIPSTLVVDPQGRLAVIVVGGVTQQKLSEVVGKVVLESTRSTSTSTATPSASAKA